MKFKSSALVFAAFGVGPLLLAAGCGDSSGDGAGSLLTPIQPSSYVTIEPATTTTTTTIPAGAEFGAGEISPVEQTYIVKAGDSLSKIAELYDISVEVLINYNGWTDGTNHLLLPGDEILIPPNTPVPGGAPAGGTGGSEAEAPADDNEGSGCTHTIKAGENPTKVAGQYGLTYDQLQAANPFMDFTTTFIVGDVLTIPAEGNC